MHAGMLCQLHFIMFLLALPGAKGLLTQGMSLQAEPLRLSTGGVQQRS
jgi:hypothetical protein